MDKKIQERRALDIVIRQLGVVPRHIETTEEPDFLVALEGTIFGAEVMDLLVDASPQGGSAMKAIENEERIIVEMACNAAVTGQIPAQHLQVRLSPRLLQKRHRSQVASALCDYVASHCAAPGEVRTARRRDLPPEIVHITMYGLAESNHQWHGPRSGWVYADFVEGFQSAIDRKESLLANYRTRCAKCWLLLFAPFDGGSSFVEWSDAVASHEFRSQFDRVFFVHGGNNVAHELKLSVIGLAC